MQLFNCDHCGIEYKRYDKRPAKKNYCSKSCQSSHNRVSRKCKGCGTTFSFKKSVLSRSNRGKYCSKDCMDNYRSVTKVCKSCGVEFRFKKSHAEKGHGIYCSLKCRSAGFIESGAFKGKNNPRYIDGKSHTPEYVCRSSHNRRVKVKNNGGSYSLAEWEQLCDKYENRCLACGRGDVLLSVDHIVPIIHGGSNNIDNLQPLCVSCNSRKNKKTIDYR